MLDAVYPRPQLQREAWQSLDGPWRFCYDDERRFIRPADVDHWPLTIRVPMPPESQASGIGDRGFHRCCWYERDFTCPPLGDERVVLHFGAVDYEARASGSTASA